MLHDGGKRLADLRGGLLRLGEQFRIKIQCGLHALKIAEFHVSASFVPLLAPGARGGRRDRDKTRGRGRPRPIESTLVGGIPRSRMPWQTSVDPGVTTNELPAKHANNAKRKLRFRVFWRVSRARPGRFQRRRIDFPPLGWDTNHMKNGKRGAPKRQAGKREEKSRGTVLAEQMRAEGNKLTDKEREQLGEEFLKLYSSPAMSTCAASISSA
jgi:hypothetical protein